MGVVDTIDRDKTNRAERLLFALFIPWLAIVFLSETTLTYSYPETFDSVLSLLKSTLLPLSIVLINLFLINKDSIIRKLMLLTVVLLLTSQCLLLTFNDDLLLCACLVIGMQGIDFKKILKTYLWESISLLLLTTVLAICGIIPNATFHHQGVKRYALGAYWGTDYSAKVFFLLLIVLYLYSSRLKIYHWLGLLAVSILVFVFTYGKMDLICMILAIIVFFIHEKISSRGVCREKGSSDRACSKWSCFWQKISPLASPLAAFLMTILTLLFSTGSSFILKLDDLLSRRLNWGNLAFSNIGISGFGQHVKWIGMVGAEDGVLPEGYNFVDCSYLNILFSFGIVLAVLVILFHSYLAFKNRKDTRLLIVIVFIAINCMIEHHLLEVAYNPFWAAMLATMSVNVFPLGDPSRTDTDGLVCPMTPAQEYIKRLTDILISIPGLVITALLFLIFAPIILIQSPGPVIFRQKRVGKNGKAFTLYKFRSMVPDAEERKQALMTQNEMTGLLFKIKDDPRTIPIGRFLRKTHLDEFPQFLNVLKGDMSLVGTRPPTQDEYAKYTPYHKSRLLIKPGITGLWQVAWNEDIRDFEEVVKLDRDYIRNFSILEDLRIIFKTIVVVVTGK